MALEHMKNFLITTRFIVKFMNLRLEAVETLTLIVKSNNIVRYLQTGELLSFVELSNSSAS